MLNLNYFVGVNQIIWNLLVVEGLTIARPWSPVKQNRSLIPEVFTSPICWPALRRFPGYMFEPEITAAPHTSISDMLTNPTF
jgi:hypothetical protein